MLLDEDLEVCSGARKGSGCGLLEYVVAIRTSWTAWYCEGFWSFLRSPCTLLWTSWTAWHCEGSWKKKKPFVVALSSSTKGCLSCRPALRSPNFVLSSSTKPQDFRPRKLASTCFSVFSIPLFACFLGAPVTETGTARIWQRGRHTPSCYLANSA